MQPNMTNSNNDGFVPDSQASSDGFVPDQQGQQQGSYWGDVRKNSVEGIKEWPRAAMGLADTAAKTASLTSPIEMGKSIFNGMRGTPPSETPIADDARAGFDGIKGTAKGLFQTGKDVANAAIMPGQMAFGTPAADTNFGKSFRERPLSTAANVATAAIPASRLFRGAQAAAPAAGSAVSAAGDASAVAPKAAAGADLPNFLEVKGGGGLNDIAGIREGTIRQLTKPGENPGVVGNNLAKTLQAEGAIGRTATQTFANASKIAKDYGARVSQALDNIKATNRATGEYADVLDPLHVDANETLKPILDESNQMRGPENYPESRAVGKYLKKAYDRLSDKANTNGGVLTLDHVADELKQIGSLYNKTGANDHIVDPVYHRVANLRDQMVNDIADSSGNPKLAQDLRSANEGYSRYMRILPDISRKAGMESIGQSNLSGLFGELKHAITSGREASTLTMKAGSMLKNTNVPEITPEVTKTLTDDMARQFLKKANGNKALARKLAAGEGWSF